MTLAQLKAKLILTTGTSIGEVLLGWQNYYNEKYTKTYPLILWSLSGMKFKKESRSTAIQKPKVYTVTMFAFILFDFNTQEEITVWDTLEGYVDTYLNKMNETEGITIENINNISGRYIGVDTENARAIEYEIVLKTWC